MGILELRNSLASTLYGVLGTYTFANGSTTPAIRVRSDGVGLPSKTTVTGLECVIYDTPRLRPVRQYQGEYAFYEWRIELLQWAEPVAGEILQDVASLLIFSYPGSNVSLLPVQENEGPKSRMRFEIITISDFDPQAIANGLRLENGSRLLLETGDYLLLEA